MSTTHPVLPEGQYVSIAVPRSVLWVPELFTACELGVKSRIFSLAVAQQRSHLNEPILLWFNYLKQKSEFSSKAQSGEQGPCTLHKIQLFEFDEKIDSSSQSAQGVLYQDLSFNFEIKNQ
jgi:hypothetical protein